MPASARPDSPAEGFRPDIEGLRAVAVLAVVLFHAGVPGVGGGFVGVDVFFVVSGFLITGLLWREVERTGGVRPARFYAARVRRLLPAAVTVLVATTAIGTAMLPPLQVRSVLGDAVASALYTENYRLAAQGTDYLADRAAPSPFQHYWSLGVEEQFYLLWPALLVLVARVALRSGRRVVVPRWPALAVLGVVGLGSFAVSVVWTRSAPPWAYFALPSRAWELAAGGLVALAAHRLRRIAPLLAAAAGWGGLLLVLAGCAALGTSTPFPGVAALAPVGGTALILAAGCAAPRGGVGALLRGRPLRGIGRLSYSWYLWHWPVLVLAPSVLGRPLVLPERLGAAAGSGVLAAGTLILVENPARFAVRLRRSPGRSLVLGGALTATGVCAALVASVLAPSVVGRGAAVPAMHLSAAPPERDAPWSPGPGGPADPAQQRLAALMDQVRAKVAASADAAALPADLTPSLTAARSDLALPFVTGCVLSWTGVTQRPCGYGDPAGTTTVALVGDSHAAAWFPAVEPVAQQRHWRLDVLAKVTCPLLDLPITSPYLHREYTECERWRSAVLDRLRAEHPALVLLAMSRRYGSDFGFVSYDPAWVAALTRTVTALRTTGAAVVVMGPVPDPHTWAPTCLSEHLDSAVACSPARTAAVDVAGIAAEEAATTAGGGRYADLTEAFCTADRCPLVIGNDLVYRDDNHLTVQYATFLGPLVAAEIAVLRPGS